MSASTRATMVLAAALCLVAAGATAQEVQVQVPRGPHYAGEPVEFRVVAVGFEEDPQPELSAAVSGDAALHVLDVSPSVSRSIQIINGQMTRSKEVKFVYRLRLHAPSVGRVSVGPLRLVQDGLEREAPAFAVQMQALPTSDELGVTLELPERAIYVGERVPLRVRFSMTETLRKAVEDYTLTVPLFERSEGVRFIDPGGEGDLQVNVRTASGTLELPARSRKARVAGRPGFSFELERTLVATSAGTVDVPASSLVVRRATGWQRDLFGRRVASRTERVFAQDRPRRLSVRAVPTTGRPPGFAGAVGQGFTLEVSADRTVVQVGEPIALELALSGGGDLEGASLPPLDAPGLLPPGRFRVQDGELAGTLQNGAKQFRTVVRVLDESVREIPALHYAWFDPTTERFETTRSRPIALSVRPGQTVGASDVVAAAAPDPGDEGPPKPASRTAPAASKEARGVREPGAGSTVSTGADLSIVRDAALLLSARSTTDAGSQLALLYVLGFALTLVGAVAARRRGIDPVAVARRSSVQHELTRIREARELPQREASARLADALRRLQSLAPDAGGPELDAVLDRCDALAFAPVGTSDRLEDSLAERAERVARALAEAVR